MECLWVQFFGGFRVECGVALQPLHLTRTVQHLLAYLLLYRQRTHPREILAGTLWGETDDERARACLNTALWRLRKALESCQMRKGTFLVTTVRGDVGINPDAPLRMDVAQFEERSNLISTWPSHPPSLCEVDEVEKALTLYKGELLAGFYEDWILQERERLHCLYIDVLTALLYAHRHLGNVTRSVEFGLRILKEEPFREDIHLEVMQLYQEAGQRFMAIRHYEKCKKTLEVEMGMAPSEKTRLFYESLLPAGRLSSKSSPPTKPSDDMPFRQALATLQKALETLEKVHLDVMKAARMVSEILEETGQDFPDWKRAPPKSPKLS